MNVPLAATEQLNAAYVPLSVLPLRVATTLNGHVVGMLGERTAVTLTPLAVPEIEPPLLKAGLGYVVAHVPVTAEPVCAKVNATVPDPAKLSESVPDQLPASVVTVGVVGDDPHAASPQQKRITTNASGRVIHSPKSQAAQRAAAWRVQSSSARNLSIMFSTSEARAGFFRRSRLSLFAYECAEVFDGPGNVCEELVVSRFEIGELLFEITSASIYPPG